MYMGIRLRRRHNSAPFFFYACGENKKKEPFFFFALGEFNAATTTGACGAGMFRPKKPTSGQAVHHLRRVLREIALSTQVFRQRNSATAN